MLATSLHGGLLFAFADQIRASTITKTQTEISILDLPSVSGTTRLDAKTVEKIQPKSNSGLKPIEDNEVKRLENTSEISAAKKAANSAKVIQKVSKRPVADAVTDASSVQPISTAKSVKNLDPDIANSTAPIENKHETSESITSNRIAETSSPVSIASKPQPTKTETQPVTAKILNSQKNTAKNLESISSSEPTKIVKDIKTAKLTPTSLSKRAEPTITKTVVSKVALPSYKIKKIRKIKKVSKLANPLSKKPDSPKVTAKVRVSKAAPTIASRKSLATAKIKTSNPTKVSVKTTPSAASRQNLATVVVKAPKPTKILAKTAPVTASRKSLVTTKIRTSNPTKVLAKTTPTTRSRQNRASVVVKTSNPTKVLAKTTPTTTSRKSFATAKIKTSGSPIISAKRNRPNLQKATITSRIASKKSTNSSSTIVKQLPKKSSPVKVAILARPRQITPKNQPVSTDNQATNFSKVVNFLKFHNSENKCFIALPSISKHDNIELSGFSNEKSSWPRFQKALAQNTSFKVSGSLASISDAQCHVVTFAKQSNSYPSYSASMQLDFSNIKNGEFIAGKLFFGKGRYLDLLLVDDEGTAINLNKFITLGESTSSFQLQVNLTSGEVSTSQLLLAVVTDKLLDSTRSHAPTPISDLLQNIKMEVDAKNIKMDLALTAFVVN